MAKTIAIGNQKGGVGKSILRETKAPAGHTVAADVVFTVSTDGKEDTVNMYDTPTTVSIRKVAK